MIAQCNEMPVNKNKSFSAYNCVIGGYSTCWDKKMQCINMK